MIFFSFNQTPTTTTTRYLHRPVMSSPGLYDPTSIMNYEQLVKATREGWFKLAFYLLSFFYYLYGMIYSLIQV